MLIDFMAQKIVDLITPLAIKGSMIKGQTSFIQVH